MAISDAKQDRDAMIMAGRLQLETLSNIAYSIAGFFKKFTVMSLYRKAKSELTNIIKGNYFGENQVEILSYIRSFVENFSIKLMDIVKTNPIYKAYNIAEGDEFNSEASANLSGYKEASKGSIQKGDNTKISEAQPKSSEPEVSQVSADEIKKLMAEMKGGQANSASPSGVSENKNGPQNEN